MIYYILRRLAYGIVVLTLVIVIISSIIYLAPVDPERLTFGQQYNPETLELKRKELGLDKALYVQMLYYLRDISPLAILQNSPEVLEKYSFIKILTFGEKTFVLKRPYFRESFQSGNKVWNILLEKIPPTLILALSAIVLSVFFGILLGMLAAVNQNNLIDNTAVISSVIGISVPSYVSAMILALIFGYILKAYTGLEVSGGLYDLDDFGDKTIVWKNLVLPAIALGIRPIAIITQLTRSTMLDILSQDYIRTAKAKGLSKSRILFKHVLRNALNPVVTAVSGWFAALLAGAFFVESVFNFNGLGQMTVNALLSYDIPLVLGAVLLTATLFLVVNILVDILYAVLDPRIKVA